MSREAPLRQENEILRQENEILRQENEALRKENEMLKQNNEVCQYQPVADASVQGARASLRQAERFDSEATSIFQQANESGMKPSLNIDLTAWQKAQTYAQASKHTSENTQQETSDALKKPRHAENNPRREEIDAQKRPPDTANRESATIQEQLQQLQE